jgi:two-component system cell cycle response regulator DivK
VPKLLLAEDDDFSRDILVRRLKRNGYETLAAENGREALHQAHQNKPDLILMDLDMPVMDGLSAIRELQAHERTCRIPIIVLTAHTAPHDVANAAQMGCYGYEVKPIVFRRLLDRIEEALQWARNRSSGDCRKSG